jgi:hypothetical protein
VSFVPMGFEQRMGDFQEEGNAFGRVLFTSRKGSRAVVFPITRHWTCDRMVSGYIGLVGKRLLRDMLLGLTHNLRRPGVRVGCFVGLRLSRRYHEASFTFATCTALAVTAVGRIGDGHTLFFTMTPGQRAAGNRQTAPIAQEPKVREGHLPWRETERRWEGGTV